MATLSLNKDKPVAATPTLEQQRAQDAWNCATKAKQSLGNDYDKYADAAKGLPALIMNSGLMQVLASCHEKGQKDSGRHHELVAAQLRAWLQCRFPTPITGANFETFMQDLMKVTPPSNFQAITAEAFAWLRWLRQMAPARVKGD